MNEAKRLTVLEIETKKFRRRWRGYDPAAVDAFLQQVAAHYEEVLTENHQLREELIGLREEVERYRTLENTLKESLMLAQRSADETRANAHREAELILQEARQQAEQIRREAEQRIQSLLREIETLEARKRAALLELRTLLLTHLQALEPLPLDVEHAATEPASERDAVEEPTPL